MWRSCKERKPKDGKQVLLWDSGRDPKVVLGRYIEPLDAWQPAGSHGDFNDVITHWQPLPGPPIVGLSKAPLDKTESEYTEEVLNIDCICMECHEHTTLVVIYKSGEEIARLSECCSAPVHED